ncbi:multidrug efflux pump [Alphaproteobacteria bacterium]
MNFFTIFVHHKRSTLMLLVMILLYGYYSYLKIPKESTPNVKIPTMFISITQDGISPEDAQRMLLKPIENAVRSISGVKEMTSYADEGSGIIVLKFMAGFDGDKALQDIRTKIDEVQNKLPPEAKRPTVTQIDLSLMPVLSVILTGDIPENAFVKISRNLKDKIEGIQEVSEAIILGDRKNVVEIIVKPKELEKYGLSLQYLRQIIGSNNKLVTAGSLKNLNAEYAVKVPSLIDNPRTLLNFPVYVKNGKVIKVSDVATVRSGYKDPISITRVNGLPAMVLEVSKRTGTNIIQVIEKVKSLINSEKQHWPNKLKVIYQNDQSKHIVDMLADLENGIILAAILVVIIIILSVGIKSSILISFSLPVSFFACILILYMSGFTMNMVVLFSLILTVGMVVDDAIVISEYADRKIIEGYTPENAFLNASSRMFLPIFTATLVKMTVFFPLLFWPGVMGEFMKYMPITVITIMSCSICFALFFQPALGSVFIKKQTNIDEKEVKAMLASEEGNLEDLKGLTKRYAKLLQAVLKRPKLFVVSTFGVMVLIYLIFITLGKGVEFFPNVEPDNTNIIVRSVGNLSIWQKDAIFKEIEKRILHLNREVKVFYVEVGGGKNANLQLNPPLDTIGLVRLEFVDWQLRRKAHMILKDIRTSLNDIPGVIVQIVEAKQGPKAAKPITMNVSSSEHYNNIISFIAKLRRFMSEIGGFKDIEDSRPVSGIEWHMEVKRELAAKYGFSTTDVGDIIQLATNGIKVSTYRAEDVDDEIDIMVRLAGKYRLASQLEHLKVVGMNGVAVPISTFVTKKVTPQVNRIKRVDGDTVISVNADVEYGVLANAQVKKLEYWVKQNAPSDIHVTFKGDTEDQAEASSFLIKAFLGALLAMFIIMLVQFNNFYNTFVVMSAVFLSTAGVLLGLLVSFQPFNIVMCGLGIIALAGIVLNNNILFVDTYKRLRESGHENIDAILRAGVQRMRPILLTASAAILGLLPMVIGLTINFFDRSITYGAPSSQWWKQLAAAISGGLTFATVLTLFCTPCLLSLAKNRDKIKPSLDVTQQTSYTNSPL